MKLQNLSSIKKVTFGTTIKDLVSKVLSCCPYSDPANPQGQSLQGVHFLV